MTDRERLCIIASMAKPLYWDAIFEIALALKAQYLEVNLEDVSIQDVYQWVIGLQEFADDPALATDEILLAIFQEWYEELD